MILIENSGSTNTTGYLVFLDNFGNWKARDQEDTPYQAFPKGRMPLVTKLFSDLKVAMPLTSLPVRHGMRSASFGTRTYITYKDQRSPDLTFGGDVRANALKADIDAITKVLHVGNAPRRARVLLIAPPTTP